MKLSEYKNAVEFLRNKRHAPSSLEDVALLYPQFSSKTLGSIYSQECQRKMKKTHHMHMEKMDEYYFSFWLLIGYPLPPELVPSIPGRTVYCEEVSNHVTAQVMLKMAYQADLSPALLARIILERHLAFSLYNGQPAPKSLVSQMLKDTGEIDDTRLAMEIDVCLAADDVYGPIVDIVKNSIGHEYEFLLQRLLDEAGLSYLDESRLRGKGYDKTPDFILQVPIAVDGHVVNWIESKASFGDPESHAGYLKDQFWSYWNRFGSGLVIYWFGFIDELDVNRDRGILLMNHLPKNIVTMPCVL